MDPPSAESDLNPAVTTEPASEIAGALPPGSSGVADTSKSVLTVDDVGIIQHITAGAVDLLGHRSEATIGLSIFDFVHPDDINEAARLFVRRLGYAGSDFGHDVRVRDASGEWISLTVSAGLVPDASNSAIALTLRPNTRHNLREKRLRRQLVVEEYCNKLSAQFMDAADPKQIVATLESSLAELALLTGAQAASVFLERHEHRELDRMARWVEPLLDAETGMDTVDITIDPDTIEAVLTAPFRTDDLARSEYRDSPVVKAMKVRGLISAPMMAGTQRGVLFLLRFDLEHRWVDADAELTGRVAMLYGRALRTARVEELLALTYQQGPIGFSVRTFAGTFVDCNQPYLDLLGLTREEIIDQNLSDLLHPEDQPLVKDRFERLRVGAETRIQHETRIRHNDGGWRWVRVNAVRLDPSGLSEPYVLTAVEDVTENHEQRIQLEFAAGHDSLTGVASRKAMRDTIERFATANHRLPNLLIIDLDRFKLTNDSLGHMAGDEVLRATARRILDHVGAGDLVARLGGDEFAVVVEDAHVRDTLHLAERLRRSMKEPLMIGGRAIEQTISIGIAIGAECDETADLLVRADRAMYAAKTKGRNRHVVFDDAMRDEALARVAIERDLRRAIDNDEFDVHFQPEFALHGREVLGAEALLRWNHPRLGLQPAGYFIDVAEQSGLIDEIGRFALREACRSFALVTSMLGQPELLLRVNISAREFARPEMPELVRSALGQSGLPPDRLCLEMTETTLMDSPEITMDTFARLHNLGVEFAIDDFGTGYSSLSYLKRFPVDSLKIDRSFVEDISTNSDSRAIVESIMGLSFALSLDVVAEGIETEDQLDVLSSLGCRRGQGYLLAGALASSDFVSFVQS